MDREIKFTIDLICSYLYDSLPRLRIEALKEELKKIIMVRLKSPLRPAHEFCILHVAGKEPDPTIIPIAAKAAYLDPNEIFLYLNKNQFTVWLKQGHVMFRIGNQTDFRLFESESDGFDELKDLSSESPTFLIDAITNTIVERSFFSSGEEFSRSSSVSPYNHLEQTMMIESNNTQNISDSEHLTSSSKNGNFMTAGIFAQTKFGSTKLRNCSNNPCTNSTTTMPTSSGKNISLRDPPLSMFQCGRSKVLMNHQMAACINQDICNNFTSPTTSTNQANSRNLIINKKIDTDFNDFSSINRINIF